MSRALERVAALPHVMNVDDERDIGNGIIVMLKDGYEFVADPGCGTRGFDTVAEMTRGCAKAQVRIKC